jgi:hypothetical protein
MGFFDIPPLDEEDEELGAEIDELPEGRWLGGVVPVEEIIGASEQAAIGVRRIVAYPDGFQLDVVAWVRKPERRRRRRFLMSHGIMLQDHGYGYRDEDGTVAKDLVRFGVQFPDGGKVTNLDRGPGWPDATEPMHGMSGRGGSSSDSEAEQDFWIWPVPESGDIELVCEWPGYGIGDSRLTISGDELRAAAGRARLVWPQDPPAPDQVRSAGRSSRHHQIGQLRSRLSAARTAFGTEPPDPAGTGDVGPADQAED